MNGSVVIVDYDPRWPGLYEEESARVREAAAESIMAVEHVGSTAVPGLAAKPIVDIMAGVAGAAAAELCLAPLADVGYTDVTPQPPEEKEWYYCLGRHPAEGRGYHVHLMQYPSACWNRHILFRDYLRGRADVARAYRRLKRELAARFRDDRLGYTEAKDDFIEKTLARARREMEDKKP
jgi:GrpB-like predicted nucleotidyltransferase (UPF0157 family)